jgi:threonine dehydratase
VKELKHGIKFYTEKYGSYDNNTIILKYHRCMLRLVGGMAAGVACALKTADPFIRIVGVEAEHQASMTAAMYAGEPVLLDQIDHFCDGTAVRQAGKLTHALCSELLDDIVTVSNDEVRSAIRYLWEDQRIVPEPSGAMGLAALLRETNSRHIEHAVVIMSGSNMDFNRLVALAG